MAPLRTLSLACILSIAAVAAQARTRHVDADPVTFDRHAIHSGGSEIGARMFIRDAAPSKRATRGKAAPRKTNSQARMKQAREPSSSAARGEAQLLPHPVGCPARAFCGCGASIEVFGKSIRELWLARAWFKFPRAEPAPGMVAVRRHHVFVIREVRAPGLVLAYDANSGGRRTRIHLRSLAGYTVVDPRRGSRYATAGG